MSETLSSVNPNQQLNASQKLTHSQKKPLIICGLAVIGILGSILCIYAYAGHFGLPFSGWGIGGGAVMLTVSLLAVVVAARQFYGNQKKQKESSLIEE